MTDRDARELIAKYSTSAYFVEGGIALALRTDPPTMGELVAGQAENVEEVKRMRDRIKARFEQAEMDGLFDTDALETVSERVQALWAAAIDTMVGDKVRAIVELRHWREYYSWAMNAVRSTRAPSPNRPMPRADAPVEREPGEEG